MHNHGLMDHKQVLPVWVIDEAQNLPPEFFRNFPAFLNFAFDSRSMLTIWLAGHPHLAQTLDRVPYAALANRIQDGSSPLARGTQQRGDNGQIAVRFIPARAGNTSTPSK